MQTIDELGKYNLIFCSLLWNQHERELLSSHGFTENQLILWKYPSMVKMAELKGYTARVLFTTQVPKISCIMIFTVAIIF